MQKLSATTLREGGRGFAKSSLRDANLTIGSDSASIIIVIAIRTVNRGHIRNIGT